MKKTLFYFTFIVNCCGFLAACSTMDNLHNKLADMQMRKAQLANGNTATIGYNLPPTAAWSCQPVGYSKTYNWAMLKTEGQFYLNGGPHGLLAKKAVDEANQQNIAPNYINLQIPT